MIKNIKWNNYKSLQNLDLDFTKPDGSIYNTIVLAGENGSGKTTILESIAEFLNAGSIEPFKSIDYSVNNNSYTIKPLENNKNANIGFHLRKNNTTGEETGIYTSKNNSPEIFKNDTEDIRYYGVTYSKARSGFRTNKVESVKNNQLDIEKYQIDENEDFTSIKQLIVDVDAQDNAAWMEETELNIGTSFSDFKQKSSMFRFRNAFNTFFDTIQFDKVDNKNPDEKKILFKKFGHKISVDDLSTGEKQIVFRGAYLLKNIKGINGGIVLIDEPELSMHPLWQKKIFDYYKNLFIENGVQIVQIIIATHSEYVLQSAIKDKNDTLLIALRNENGIIKYDKVDAPVVLPVLTYAETNYLAFNVYSVDFHIALYGYLQTLINKCYISDCDNYILNNSLYNPSTHGKPSFHGKTQYNTLCTYIRNAIDHPDSGNTYTEQELETSTKLLIEICKSLKSNP
ncbi:AAA family ATPase [bacterium]|nr:AAA family ATPase [bacterium]